MNPNKSTGFDPTKGQTPEKKFEYLLVGDGRLARHLSHYFKLVSDLLKTPISYAQWSRKTGSQSELFALADQSEKILLAISDNALKEYCSLLPGRKIHFSGATVIAGIDSFHPLMTFSESLYDLNFYQKIPFIGESGKNSFPELFPQFVNPHYQISADQKVFYHALCVMSGNFTTLLWKKYFEEMSGKFDLPLKALSPYMQAVFNNIENNYKNALTGPLARGDKQVIERHLETLSRDAFLPVYEGFIKTFETLQENSN